MKIRRVFQGLFFLAALLCAGVAPGFAETKTAGAKPTDTQAKGVELCPICKYTANKEAYSTKAGTTFVRGAANTMFGWTEFIRQPAQEVKSGGNVFSGIAKGFGEGMKRTASGIGEVLTFWTPKVNNEYVHFANDCPICMGRRQQEQKQQQLLQQHPAQ